MPSRLLMTADAVGGVWTYATDLAGALLDQGIATTIALIGPPPDAGQRAALPAGAALVETGLPLDWLAEDEGQVRAAGRRLAALADELAVDAVQLNGPAFAGGAGFAVPVVGVCHSCLSSWWSAVREEPMPPFFRTGTAMMAKGLAACDLLVAPSAAFAREIARLYGVPLPRVVHNGRAAPAARAAPRARRVFTAGRLWDHGKNIAALDAAAARLDAPVVAAGPLTSPAGEAVALRHARALGSLPPAAVRDWAAGSAVFATAALYEPFGLAVLEAAQAGCALALSDIPTFRELWDGAALFLPPRDPGAIAASLQDLLDDPDRIATLAEAARERAGRYTAAAMAEGMAGLYRGLLLDGVAA